MSLHPADSAVMQQVVAMYSNDYDESASGSGASSSTNQSPRQDSFSSGSGTGNHRSSATSIGGSTSDGEDDFFGRKDSRKWLIAKLIVLLLLGAVATVVSLTWYRRSTAQETQRFKDELEPLANQLIWTFFRRLEVQVSAATSLALSLSSNHVEEEWPFVSMPQFEARTAGIRRLARATSVWISPVVTPADQAAWETYAQGQYPSTLDKSFVDPYRGGDPDDVNITEGSQSNHIYDETNLYRDSSDWTLMDGMYRFDETGTPVSAWVMPEDEDVGDGDDDDSSSVYYSPIWQSAPQTLTASTVLFDQRSDRVRRPVLDKVRTLGIPLFSGKILDATKEDQTSLSYQYSDGPHVALFAPIFKQVLKEDEDPEDATATVVGFVNMDISWASFWEHGLVGLQAPLTMVLESSCDGDLFSYEIGASSMKFLGAGDIVYHHPLDDEINMQTEFDDFADALGFDGEDDSICSYKIGIYPSRAFEDLYRTKLPLYSALGFTAICLFTVAVFVFYDVVIQRRQRKVVKSVQQSNAIIKSLFPAGVRKRLMGSTAQNSDREKRGKQMEHLLPDNYSMMTTHKLRLKTYLNNAAELGASSRAPASSHIIGSEPIAEFFNATTVMFADLSGFTAWSSTREPSQVFMLLETLYGAMDKAAKRHRVFKVETVGDCYVAATGIPDPRSDHAVLMLKFAGTSVSRINELTAKLESELGPGTSELCMRVGIHSGPVTAGVLRGEKSRFQLFGDTMNIAARMESTGVPDRIHISAATAELLRKAGRENWLEPREDKVSARGKGELVTFWATPSTGKGSSSSIGLSVRTDFSGYSSDGGLDASGRTTSIVGYDGTIRSTNASRSIFDKLQYDNDRKERLVDYNVDVLISLLKKIVARRSVVQDIPEDLDQSIRSGGSTNPSDEVKEVIEMPKYNPEAAVQMQGAPDVTISEDVCSELREYVSKISRCYEENPFHNFEHASHVALSANKLLKRIVMPEEVDYSRASTTRTIEKVLAVAEDLHTHTLGISSDPFTQFSVVFSALIHDAGHTGVPNFILANEEPEVASQYRNQSIAEQRSIDIAWEHLMEPQYASLRQCMFSNVAEQKHFRQLIVNSVMATDIFDKEQSAMRKARWQKCFDPEQASIEEQSVRDDAFNRKATIVIEHIIQASDVAHTMQHWHVYQKWNQRLFFEMYTAYIEGRSDKDPSLGWYKGEIWFFDNYVIPLAKKLKECGVFGVSSAEYLKYALENRDEWERKGQDVVVRMLRNFEPNEDLVIEIRDS